MEGGRRGWCGVVEEGEPWSSLTWARRRPCPFLGAGRPSCMFVHGGVVFVHGRPCTVIFICGGCHGGSHVVIHGGGVVVCGARPSWMGRGRPWALNIHEWGSSVGTQRLWVVVVVYAGRLCGVSSVGGCHCLWGHRVHLCWSGGGHLWAVVIICRQSWPPVGLDHPCVGGHRPWVVVVNGRLVVGDGGALVVVVPRRPGLWAFVAQKVAIDVACT